MPRGEAFGLLEALCNGCASLRGMLVKMAWQDCGTSALLVSVEEVANGCLGGVADRREAWLDANFLGAGLVDVVEPLKSSLTRLCVFNMAASTSFARAPGPDAAFVISSRALGR